jgi:lysophospholipase L1-like esterase
MNQKTLIQALLLWVGALRLSNVHAAELPSAFTSGARVLFQGDSITDMNRGRNTDPNHILGHSYAFIIGAQIGAHFPEQKLTFVNRGVSGNSVTDLVGRWKKDTLGEKPDILSVLIGINDVGKAFRAGARVDAAAFEKAYDGILADARSANPKLKIVLCEPFVEPGSNTRERWTDWKEDVDKLQSVVGRLAVKYHAPVVRLQKVFDEAGKRAEITYWVWDGVHPTAAGQQLFAEEWLKCVREAWTQP